MPAPQGGEKGLGTSAVGAASGGFLGHKLGGRILGTAGGALAGAAGLNMANKWYVLCRILSSLMLRLSGARGIRKNTGVTTVAGRGVRVPRRVRLRVLVALSVIGYEYCLSMSVQDGLAWC